jgi:hypothetical protein
MALLNVVKLVEGWFDMAIFKPKPVAPKPVMGKPVAPKPVAPTPVIGKPVMPGIKPLPPGSIGMPGGPGGKTMYNTGPMPGNVEQNYRGIPGLVNATAPIGGPGPIKGPMPPQVDSGRGLGAGAGFNNPNANANFAAVNSMVAGKPMAKGGKASSASKRADGIAQRGKTRA